MAQLSSRSKQVLEQTRRAAENDLEYFIKLVHPDRVLGHVHSRLIRWWTREEAKHNSLCLLPRDHQKSALIAYRVAWEITRNPAVRVLYLSSTSNLAVKQLNFIKKILTNDIYRIYWPDMVNPEEAKREKWTETEISVDHPARQRENTRDPTIFVGGLTTNIVGLHCDIAVFDDIVVFDNAYTQEGRDRVAQQYSLLASIESADAREWVVGTRYHPNDLYSLLTEKVIELYNTDGELTSSEPLFEKFEEQVEDRGDGFGNFLWPRMKRPDGKWFGFDSNVLARKKAQYIDQTQFRAQYYNDPNEYGASGITNSDFQYYDRKYVTREGGSWSFKGTRLNVFAAVDFAWSLAKRADFTTICVIGVDRNSNIYVLDIERFKSDKISEYFKKILMLHRKWDFRKIRAEITAAQEVIVKDLKENYIRPHGLALSIDDYRPTRNEGTKAERIYATLQPRYANRNIWHYQGGNCQLLEEELLLAKPPHDDIKDSLSSAVDIAVPPSGDWVRTTSFIGRGTGPSGVEHSRGLQTHSRFGGVY